MSISNYLKMGTLIEVKDFLSETVECALIGQVGPFVVLYDTATGLTKNYCIVGEGDSMLIERLGVTKEYPRDVIQELSVRYGEAIPLHLAENMIPYPAERLVVKANRKTISEMIGSYISRKPSIYKEVKLGHRDKLSKGKTPRTDCDNPASNMTDLFTEAEILNHIKPEIQLVGLEIYSEEIEYILKKNTKGGFIGIATILVDESVVYCERHEDGYKHTGDNIDLVELLNIEELPEEIDKAVKKAFRKFKKKYEYKLDILKEGKQPEGKRITIEDKNKIYNETYKSFIYNENRTWWIEELPASEFNYLEKKIGSGRYQGNLYNGKGAWQMKIWLGKDKEGKYGLSTFLPRVKMEQWPYEWHDMLKFKEGNRNVTSEVMAAINAAVRYMLTPSEKEIGEYIRNLTPTEIKEWKNKGPWFNAVFAYYHGLSYEDIADIINLKGEKEARVNKAKEIVETSKYKVWKIPAWNDRINPYKHNRDGGSGVMKITTNHGIEERGITNNCSNCAFFKTWNDNMPSPSTHLSRIVGGQELFDTSWCTMRLFSPTLPAKKCIADALNHQTEVRIYSSDDGHLERKVGGFSNRIDTAEDSKSFQRIIDEVRQEATNCSSYCYDPYKNNKTGQRKFYPEQVLPMTQIYGNDNVVLLEGLPGDHMYMAQTGEIVFNSGHYVIAIGDKLRQNTYLNGKEIDLWKSDAKISDYYTERKSFSVELYEHDMVPEIVEEWIKLFTTNRLNINKIIYENWNHPVSLYNAFCDMTEFSDIEDLEKYAELKPYLKRKVLDRCPEAKEPLNQEYMDMIYVIYMSAFVEDIREILEVYPIEAQKQILDYIDENFSFAIFVRDTIYKSERTIAEEAENERKAIELGMEGGGIFHFTSYEEDEEEYDYSYTAADEFYDEDMLEEEAPARTETSLYEPEIDRHDKFVLPEIITYIPDPDYKIFDELDDGEIENFREAVGEDAWYALSKFHEDWTITRIGKELGMVELDKKGHCVVKTEEVWGMIENALNVVKVVTGLI